MESLESSAIGLLFIFHAVAVGGGGLSFVATTLMLQRLCVQELVEFYS